MTGRKQKKRHTKRRSSKLQSFTSEDGSVRVNARDAEAAAKKIFRCQRHKFAKLEGARTRKRLPFVIRDRDHNRYEFNARLWLDRKGFKFSQRRCRQRGGDNGASSWFRHTYNDKKGRQVVCYGHGVDLDRDQTARIIADSVAGSAHQSLGAEGSNVTHNQAASQNDNTGVMEHLTQGQQSFTNAVSKATGDLQKYLTDTGSAVADTVKGGLETMRGEIAKNVAAGAQAAANAATDAANTAGDTLKQTAAQIEGVKKEAKTDEIQAQVANELDQLNADVSDATASIALGTTPQQNFALAGQAGGRRRTRRRGLRKTKRSRRRHQRRRKSRKKRRRRGRRTRR